MNKYITYNELDLISMLYGINLSIEQIKKDLAGLGEGELVKRCLDNANSIESELSKLDIKNPIGDSRSLNCLNFHEWKAIGFDGNNNGWSHIELESRGFFIDYVQELKGYFLNMRFNKSINAGIALKTVDDLKDAFKLVTKENLST